MNAPSRLPKVYPNSPLIEVALEIKFPGEPALECKRDEIFSIVRQKLPQVFVPQMDPLEPIALKHYHFKSSDTLVTLMVALNSLVYSTKQYKGFTVFRREALRYLLPIGKRFHLSRLTRVGLRYVNVIPFRRRSGTIPLNEYLNLNFQVPTGKLVTPLEFRFAAAQPCDNGVLTVRIEPIKGPDQNESLLVDFDFGFTDDLQLSHLDAYLNKGHAFTKQLFEALITDDYRRVMMEVAVQ